MKKNKRIYYVSGLISLIGLPILCCIYLYNNFRQEGILEVTFAEKYDKSRANHFAYDTTLLSSPEYKRKYIEIELNGKRSEDETKINFLRVSSQKIMQNRDTINGIHLIFGDGSKYSSFIKVLNNFRIDSIPSYCCFETHMWMLYVKGSEIKYRARRKARDEEIREQNNNRTMTTDLSFSDKLSYFKTLWPISIAFILLVIFSIKRLKI